MNKENNTQNSAVIKIENLTKRFEDIVAVNNLNLEIKEGELFAFLGPNGAGKTTTIKILTGLLKPTVGRAFINGVDIQENPLEAKKIIGYIPDHPYLYEKLSGRDFFHFVGDLFKIPRTTQIELMDFYFNLFGLQNAKNKLIENYSHGMRQKLIFSVCLMHNPKVIIIDEPMVGLDPKSTRIVKNILKEKSREGITVFLSTHTLSIAEELADRIGIINYGKLIFLGTLQELKESSRKEGTLEELFLKLTEEEDLDGTSF